MLEGERREIVPPFLKLKIMKIKIEITEKDEGMIIPEFKYEMVNAHMMSFRRVKKAISPNQFPSYEYSGDIITIITDNMPDELKGKIFDMVGEYVVKETAELCS